MLHMERIGVTELRRNGLAYIERVKAGESFEVTIRGRVKAHLVPVEPRSDLPRPGERLGEGGEGRRGRRGRSG
jgi:prevent-host-death family protein